MSSLVANPHSGTPVNQHRSSLTVSTVPSTSPLRHGQTETETVVEGERQLEDGVPSHLPSPKYADRAGTLRHPSRDNIRKTFAEKTILSSQQAISPTLPMLTDSDLPEADCEWQSMSGPLFSSMSAPRDPSPSFNLSSAAPSFSLVSPSISPAQTPVLNPQTIMAELTIANQSAMDDPVADPKQTAPFAPNGGGSPGNRVFYGNGYVGGAGGGGGSVGPRATAADGGGGGGGGSGSREGSPSGSPRPAAVPQWNNHVPQYGTHASHGSGIFNQGHSAGGGGGGGVYPQKPMHTGEANRMRKIESGVGKVLDILKQVKQKQACIEANLGPLTGLTIFFKKYAGTYEAGCLSGCVALGLGLCLSRLPEGRVTELVYSLLVAVFLVACVPTQRSYYTKYLLGISAVGIPLQVLRRVK